MVSEASRWKKLQRHNWRRSDGLGDIPVDFDYGYAETIERERCHSPTKHLSGQRNQLGSSRKGHATKGMMSLVADESSTDATNLPRAELEPSTEGDDVESLSEILEGPYSKEMKRSECETVCHVKNKHREEIIENPTVSASQLTCCEDEREPLDWISDALKDEGQTSNSLELHEGTNSALHTNHPSLKKRLKRFLVVQRATMWMNRRDLLEAGNSRLLRLGKEPGSEVHRYGDTTVVIHYETRDAISEASPTISNIRRKSKFQGWKDTIKRHLRNIASSAPSIRPKTLSDTDSVSSDQLKDGNIDFESYDGSYENIDKEIEYDEWSDDSSWLSEDMYNELRFLPPLIERCICGVNDQCDRRDWKT